MKSRSNLGFGLFLILIGALFLAVQLVPGLGDWFRDYFDWPFFVIGAGLFLLLLGLFVGAPGMAVPASIVTGIGGLLLWQNATGNWESWAYVWTFIPGFVGLGVIIAALFGEGGRAGIRSGGWLILISLILYAIFGSFLGAGILSDYWPILLILLGLWILFQPILRR
ncbi:MAG: hypothetical protein PVG32_11545 [Anaerolineales bacterium]